MHNHSSTVRCLGAFILSALYLVAFPLVGNAATLNLPAHNAAANPAITTGSATQFVVTAPATATAGTAFSFTVTAEDQFGNIAADYTGVVAFTSTDPSAILPADTTLTGGIGTFTATFETAGNQTITATDTTDSSITGTSNPVTLSAGAATHFLVAAPSTATAGTAFNFTVTAEDQFGNIATGYSGTVHFTSSDAAASLPADSTLALGIGTFTATLNSAGGQTITATDTTAGSITGTSNTVIVSPGTHLVITAPATVTAGTAFTVTVTAEDDLGNIATGYTGTVHFTSTDPVATLPADSPLTNGVSSFIVTLNTGGDQTITGTDTTNPSITGTSSAVVVVLAGLTDFAAGLQMISAPADYTGFTPSQIFSPAGANLALWQPALDTYAITPTAPADTIRPGAGYWVHFTAATTLLDTGTHVDVTKPFTISLTKGWNMIGDPFPVNVPLSSITVDANGAEQPFPGGGRWSGTPVMDTLYTYPAGATAYQTETSALRPYAGYWLYAYQNCTLIISAP